VWLGIKKGEVRMAKLDVKALGLTLGLVWAVGILIMGILATASGYGAGFMRALGTVYLGAAPTIKGSIVGAIWGFVDAGIGGLVIAWVYNKLAK
jgi:hypothetical protein